MFMSRMQAATTSRRFTAYFRHLGAFGLFFLAILDSTPLPTFGGVDILTVILVATRRNPWYEYAAVAAAGSVVGAYITFRLARHAGRGYLEGKFGSRTSRYLKVFEEWGTGALAASTAVPFPFPTSVFFAAAGASKYDTRKFISVVVVCRACRYAAVAFIADRYGRHIIRVFRHPVQYGGWFLLFSAIIVAIVVGGILVNKRLAESSTTAWQAKPAQT